MIQSTRQTKTHTRIEEVGSIYDDITGFNVYPVKIIPDDGPSKYIAILLTSEVTRIQKENAKFPFIPLIAT